MYEWVDKNKIENTTKRNSEKGRERGGRRCVCVYVYVCVCMCVCVYV